jgi:hypothetical protein
VTNYGVTLLVDGLPLYASKAQILAAIASTATGQGQAAANFFRAEGFPRPTPEMQNLYYVPAVLKFIADFEAARVKVESVA